MVCVFLKVSLIGYWVITCPLVLFRTILARLIRCTRYTFFGLLAGSRPSLYSARDRTFSLWTWTPSCWATSMKDSAPRRFYFKM